MTPAQLIETARRSSDLSVRALAEAAGVSASTVHRIEQGAMEPTVEMLRKLLEATGMSLQLSADADYGVALIGLADAIKFDIANADESQVVRRAAELVARFERESEEVRRRMLAAQPATTGDERWDAFLGALGEWLAVRSDLEPPTWTNDASRYLRNGWWVTSMQSMHAWEYAGTPASFQNHGVYIHRDSLVNV